MKKRSVPAMTIAIVVALFAGPSAGGDRSYVWPNRPDGDGPPVSSAVRIGDTLYLSGDIGLDEEGKVPTTARAEARLLLDSIKGTLEAAGFSMDDLVSVTIYCSDVEHYDDFNQVYRSYFKKEFPARAFVGTGRLLFGARFEMQAIAIKR